MTYDDLLQFHVREFDQLIEKLRAIMLQKNYDNNEAREVIELKKEIMDIVHYTFMVKQCHSRASYIKKKLEASK